MSYVIFESGRSCIVTVVPWSNKSGELTSCSDVVCDRYISAGRRCIILVSTDRDTTFFIKNLVSCIEIAWRDIGDKVVIDSHISHLIQANSDSM